jgi:hypothetical protein
VLLSGKVDVLPGRGGKKAEEDSAGEEKELLQLNMFRHRQGAA